MPFNKLISILYTIRNVYVYDLQAAELSNEDAILFFKQQNSEDMSPDP